VWFVLISTAIFQIMPDGRIEIAVHGDALLPVVIAVLLSALLIVDSHI
jgi:hypothetical protein